MSVYNQISHQFFRDLKQYNNTNFKALHTADLSEIKPEDAKAFSSVITRYFIFCEKHPEFSETDKRLLYYQLKLDMIARYFSGYPSSDPVDLVAFQTELRLFIKSKNGGESDAEPVAV